jgi:selT/selW/selH-like putative selenoprotein
LAETLVSALRVGGASPIKEVRLITSDGGRFEVSIDDVLVFSKLASRRHPNADEIIAMARQRLDP